MKIYREKVNRFWQIKILLKSWTFTDQSLPHFL